VSDLLAEKRRFLAEQTELGRRASDALDHTWSKVNPERIGESDPDLQETLEALTARFARLGDILIKRAFRAVVSVELADGERMTPCAVRAGRRAVLRGRSAGKRLDYRHDPA
jgi:hypothetical protein